MPKWMWVGNAFISLVNTFICFRVIAFGLSGDVVLKLWNLQILKLVKGIVLLHPRFQDVQDLKISRCELLSRFTFKFKISRFNVPNMTTDEGPRDSPPVPYGTSKRGTRCRMVLDLTLSTNFNWFFKPICKSRARCVPFPVPLVLLLLLKGGLLLLLQLLILLLVLLLLILLQLLLLQQLLLLILGTFNLAILKSGSRDIYKESGHL